jgi:hypothetical protein
MHHYRIYLLTCDNHIDDVHVTNCVSDNEAEDEAACVLQDYPAAEIWCGSRLVGRISSDQAESDVLGAVALTCI